MTTSDPNDPMNYTEPDPRGRGPNYDLHPHWLELEKMGRQIEKVFCHYPGCGRTSIAGYGYVVASAGGLSGTAALCDDHMTPSQEI